MKLRSVVESVGPTISIPPPVTSFLEFRLSRRGAIRWVGRCERGWGEAYMARKVIIYTVRGTVSAMHEGAGRGTIRFIVTKRKPIHQMVAGRAMACAWGFGLATAQMLLVYGTGTHQDPGDDVEDADRRPSERGEA